MNPNVVKNILMFVATIFIIVALILAGLVSGYYAPAITQKDQKISDQSDQIDSLTAETITLNAQIQALNAQIQGLNDTIADLNTQLTEVQNEKAQLEASIKGDLHTYLGWGEQTNSNPYHLWITGGVKNEGRGTAYNAGLLITGYSATNELLVNITVPIDYGTYQTAFGTPSTLSSLYPTQSVNVQITIYHSGTVDINKVTIIPVWTNSP